MSHKIAQGRLADEMNAMRLTVLILHFEDRSTSIAAQPGGVDALIAESLARPGLLGFETITLN